MVVQDVLIVGAGPAGLSAAIAAKQAGFEYEVVEKGVLVNSIYNFPAQMVFFTTPELIEIGNLPLVSPYEKPTRIEALRYYRRVVDAYRLKVSLGEEVIGIEPGTPGGGGPAFAVETLSRHGARRVRHARALVMAIGYYDHPNMLGIPGEALPHVYHYYSEAHGYYGQHVVIVGGRNSAALNALELYRAGAHVTIVHRRAALGDSIKYWIRPDIENRIKEGSIAARFSSELVEIRPRTVLVRRVDEDCLPAGDPEEIPADAVFLMTGYHADGELLADAGVAIDPETLVPAHDPETLETNVPNLFLAGGVVTGKDTAPIFIENGRFHGDAIVRVLKERFAAVAR